MFNTRKSDQFPGSPGMGTLKVFLAALIALYFVFTLFSSGSAPYVIIGCLALFGIWWIYNTFFSKSQHNELAKYQKAVKKQKKNSSHEEKGKVVYLANHKRK
jgi:fatty acid desaturase